MIGFHEKSRIWVAHGNKVLRCAPQQLREVTPEQEAALRYVPVEVLAKKGKYVMRGAQTFTDISGKDMPGEKERDEPIGEPLPKRQRRQEGLQSSSDAEEIHGEDDQGDEAPMAQAGGEGEIDEESTVTGDNTNVIPSADGTETGSQPPELNAVAIPFSEGSSSAYGPVREMRNVQHETTALTDALRRSTELLDMGDRRAHAGAHGAYEVHLASEEHNTCEMSVAEWKMRETAMEQHLESFLVNDRGANELRDKDLTAPEDVEKVNKGKIAEWEKLMKHRAIRCVEGPEATKIRNGPDAKRIMDSRFVKTRKAAADGTKTGDIKCRWVIKGFQDPDIDTLLRQSPTLTADGLAVTLQIISSMRWYLNICDIEGAFLQGGQYERPQGKIYARIPKKGVPNVSNDCLVELTKCVYGLIDAPLQWWNCFTKCLTELGMRQSELDPCCFRYYHDHELHGVLALHVDDMVLGGSHVFMQNVVKKMREKFPFKHWITQRGEFLGRQLEQKDDFSIVIDQASYARKVKTIEISKERRKEKDSPVNEKEKQQLRAVLGAANWMVGSSRPDLAAHTALLQQSINKACVSDLIEANKLVARIRDFAHVTVQIRSIPLEHAMVVATSDASWSNTETLGSQAGYFILFADRRLEDNHWAHVSALRWKSYKMERKTQSTLAAELMALARAVAECNWIRSLFGEMIYENYTLEKGKQYREKIRMMLVIDCKPVYDHIHGVGVVVKDKRVAIDMLLVRRDLRSTNAVLRWVDTRQMLSDALTKLNADPEFMQYVLKFGQYIVVKETDSLKWRSQERNNRQPRGKRH